MFNYIYKKWLQKFGTLFRKIQAKSQQILISKYNFLSFVFLSFLTLNCKANANKSFETLFTLEGGSMGNNKKNPKIFM